MKNLSHLKEFLTEIKLKTIERLKEEAKEFYESIDIELSSQATNKALNLFNPVPLSKSNKKGLTSSASFSLISDAKLSDTKNTIQNKKQLPKSRTFHVIEEKDQNTEKEMGLKRKTLILEELERKFFILEDILTSLDKKLITLNEDLQQRLDEQIANEEAKNNTKYFTILIEDWQQDQKKSLHSAKEFIKAITKMPEALPLEELQNSYITLQAMPLILYKRALQLVIYSKELLIMRGAQNKEDLTSLKQDKLKREQEFEDLNLFLKEKFANPYRPCFSQEKISPCFSETQNAWTANSNILGKSVREVGEQIKASISLEVQSLIAGGAFFLPSYKCWAAMNNRALCAAAISEKEMFRFYIQFPSAEMFAFFKLKEEKILKQAGKCTPEDLLEKFFTVLFEKGKLGETGRNAISVPKIWAQDKASLMQAAVKQQDNNPSFFKQIFPKKSLEPEQMAKEKDVSEYSVEKDKEMIASLL